MILNTNIMKQDQEPVKLGVSKLEGATQSGIFGGKFGGENCLGTGFGAVK